MADAAVSPTVRRRGYGWLRGPEPVVFLIALAARLLVPLTSAGFGGFFGHDPATYYADSVALTFGKLPYADYALVHPPVIAFVLQPAAWLGRLTDDHIGFVAGDLMFMVLGALNAVLVIRVARSLQLSTVAAVAGGVVYAVWLGAVGAEFGSRLEPLGNSLFLLGLLALARARTGDSTRSALISGAFLGVAVSVKIWWAVPVLLVLGWEALAVHRPRRVGWMVVGALVAGLVVDGPPFVLSRGRMWTYVVTAQLDRHRAFSGPLRRGLALTGVDRTSGIGMGIAVGLIVAVALCLVAAWQQPGARPFAVLLVLQVGVLLMSPSYFHFYDDWLTVAGALVVSAGLQTVTTKPWPVARGLPAGRGVIWVLVGALAVLPVLQASRGVVAVTRIRDQAAFSAAAAQLPCIVSETSMDLIVMNALSRSFGPGCRDLIDPFGQTLMQRAEGVRPQQIATDRNRYLESGSAVAISPKGFQLYPGLLHDLRGDRVLVRSHGLLLICTDQARPQPGT